MTVRGGMRGGRGAGYKAVLLPDSILIILIVKRWERLKGNVLHCK